MACRLRCHLRGSFVDFVRINDPDNKWHLVIKERNSGVDTACGKALEYHLIERAIFAPTIGGDEFCKACDKVVVEAVGRVVQGA